MRAQVAVSSLVPNPNPEPIHGVDEGEGGEGAEAGELQLRHRLRAQEPASTAETDGVGAPPPLPQPPTLAVGPKRRGRPRKTAVLQPATAPSPEQAEALQPLYAKVGKLALLAAREGKDVAAFAHEVRGLLTAYEQLLGQL